MKKTDFVLKKINEIICYVWQIDKYRRLTISEKEWECLFCHMPTEANS